jgi:hypothetical protein
MFVYVHTRLGNDLKDDSALAALKDIYSLLMRQAFKRNAIDTQDLITALKTSMIGCRSCLEDSLDIDGHIAVGTAKASDNGKAQAVFTSLQLYGMSRAINSSLRWQTLTISRLHGGRGLLSAISNFQPANYHNDAALCHLQDGSRFFLRAVG